MLRKIWRATLKQSRKKPGFTLVEMLVVIVVIALLAGLLIPMVMKARTSARGARMSMDLQAIETGLEAYKADFGDYPRIPVGNAGALNGTAPNLYASQVLCWALIAPAPEVTDGAEGLGFRV